jgi:hypothetical protein
MPGRLLVAMLAIALAGCSSQEERVSAACTGDAQAIVTALQAAPGAVALADGTPLSRCISHARTEGDLQSLGIVLMRAADLLRLQAAEDPAAALRLGYLAGAVETGAASATSGIALQLARRVDQLAVLPAGAAPAATAALARGRLAGERDG